MFELSRDRTRSEEAAILLLTLEGLRTPGELTPAPGFYERVRNRIQEMQRQSIWVPLMYSRFPWRPVSVCAILALAALCYVSSAGWNANEGVFSLANAQQQRDAVLTQIVSYRKPN